MYLQQQPRNIRKNLALNRTSYSAEKSNNNQSNPIHHPSVSQEMHISPSNENNNYYPSHSHRLSKDNEETKGEEEDNTKIKEEAKLLIAKTRQMMASLNKEKGKGKRSKENSISKDRINTLANSTPSLNLFNQKLLDKAKRIKSLERELKDKCIQLKIAQDKLQTKNEEIAKLNEALTIERSNTLKAENAKLQRKIFSIEKANEENKKVYEKLIEEYKLKLSQYTTINKDQDSKIKEVEQHNKKISFEVNKLQANLIQKENSVKELTEKVDIEKKSSEHKSNQIAVMKNQLSTLIAIIRSLYDKETKRQDTTSLFLTKLKSLVNDDSDNLMKSGMSSGSDYGYDRAGINNIDYQNRFLHLQPQSQHLQNSSDVIQNDIAIDYSFN